MRAATPADQPSSGRNASIRSYRSPPARVLAVEDDEEAAESLGLILELLGHQARVVHDGPSALEALRHDSPDIMLIDVGLPGMNGYELARVIRGDPEHRDLVLAAVTGYGRPEDRDRAHEAGFDHHLVKPVDLAVLRAIVDSAAGSRGGDLGSVDRRAPPD